MTRTGTGPLLAPLLLLLLAGCRTAQTASSHGAARGTPPGVPAVVPVGRFDFEGPSFPDPGLNPEELSGIVWIGGEEYLAVGDDHACIHRLTIRIDGETGRVLGVQFGTPVRLLDQDGAPIPDTLMGADREGITVSSGDSSVWISNEHTGRDGGRSSIAKHRLRDGRMTRLIEATSGAMLGVFARQRPNAGLEALTRSADGKEIWTANEAPLTIDGDLATASTGGVVRLQKFDGEMRPVAQYPYRVDPYIAEITSPPFLTALKEVSGLSELLGLPGGRLLALERSFAGDTTGTANLRIRIYDVELAGATDVSRGKLVEGLAGRAYTPAKKRLLWGDNFGLTNSNFEGMTLGPTLANGERLLLLIADNNGGAAQALLTLRLSGLP